MELPPRYRTLSCRRRLCAVATARLQALSAPVDATLLAAYYEHALCRIEDVTRGHSQRVPLRGQWSRPIVATLVTHYRLNESDLRLKSVLFSDLSDDLRSWIDKDDLRSEAVARAMNYVANPLSAPVASIAGLYYTAVRCVCLDLLRKRRRESEAAAEMYRRLALCKEASDAAPERDNGSSFPQDETRRVLPRFCAAKAAQQLRSRRTRQHACERVRGFRLGVELLLRQHQQCAEKARLEAIRRATAINERAGFLVVVVPPRTTFHGWLRELRARIDRRAA